MSAAAKKLSVDVLERILSEHCDDAEQADLIERYLLTEDQRKKMHKARITVAGMLVGKVPATKSVNRLCDTLCRDWNARLGTDHFMTNWEEIFS